MNTLLRPLLLLFAGSIAALAQSEADTAIRQALQDQAAAWNRGDLPAFVKTYAEDCIFVGGSINRGRQQVLDRYRKTYSTPAAMGRLSFSNLEVHDIDTHAAFVLGRFHLERNASGGGSADGMFTLVWRDVDDDWLIVLDHTTPDARGPR